MLPGREYVLLVGVYATAEDAAQDLHHLRGLGDLSEAVGGAGVLLHSGGRPVFQQGGGGTLSFSIGSGAAVGVVAGVFLGAPLMLMAVGAAIGAALGLRASRREAAELSLLLADFIPDGCSGLLVIVEEPRLGELSAQLGRSLRTTGRVLDGGPLTALARSLVRGNPTVTEALDLQDGSPRRHREDRP